MQAYLEEKKNKPSYGGMNDAWKNIKPHFGHLRPEHVNRPLCREYTAKRKKDSISNGTIRKELGVLRQALRWNDPSCSAVIELPPMPAPRDRYLTRGEYNKLLAACEQHHLRVFIQLALATAGRKSALLELTWDRVDFDRGIISLGKGERRAKGRATVPMTETLRTALKSAKEASVSEYVIEYGGKPIKNVAKGFREACKRAGLEGVSPHTMRHTSAVWLAEGGVPMQEIAAYLGHSNMNTTFRVYAKFSPTYLKTAAKALEVNT